ncbi:hypothetical protein [Mycolicibacter minnesotensis]
MENLAAAFWILHPTPRNDRIEHTLRWHARNFNEQLIAMDDLGLSDESTREAKLAKLDVVATSRGISPATVPTCREQPKVSHARSLSRLARAVVDRQLGECLSAYLTAVLLRYPLRKQEAYETTDPGIVTLRLTSDLSRVLYPTITAFHLMTDVVRLLQQRSHPI